MQAPLLTTLSGIGSPCCVRLTGGSRGPFHMGLIALMSRSVQYDFAGFEVGYNTSPDLGPGLGIVRKLGARYLLERDEAKLWLLKELRKWA